MNSYNNPFSVFSTPGKAIALWVLLLVIAVALTFVEKRLDRLSWKIREVERGSRVCRMPAHPEENRPIPRRDEGADKARQMAMRARRAVQGGISSTALLLVYYSICGISLFCYKIISYYIFPRVRAWSPWLARVFCSVVPLKWKRRYGLPMPHPPADVIRAYTLFFRLFLVMCFTPGVLAAFVVLLSPGLYDPLADPPPGVSPLAVKLAEPGSWVWWIWVAILVVAGALLTLPHIGQAWRYRARVRDMEALLDDGIPVCLECGCRLDRVQGPACPRCGQPWSRWYPAKHGRPVLPRPAASGPR